MRTEQLTFTRFIAASLIVAFHFAHDTALYNGFFSSFMANTNFGVSYFFILSGFIMVISYGPKGIVNHAKFYVNRLARIYPLYLLALLLYIPIRLSIYPVDIWLPVHLLMFQSWFPQTTMEYNFPGWSISVEIFFYALFPFLLNFLMKRKKTLYIFTVVSLALWLVTQVIFNVLLKSSFYEGNPSRSYNILFYNPLMHLNQFLVGMASGFFYLKNYKKYSGNFDFLLIIISIMIFFVMKYIHDISFHNGLLAFLFVPFIIILCFNTSGRITKLFSHRVLIVLGEVSFGLYILQLPVFYYLRELDTGNANFDFLIKFLILLLISTLSYYYLETPLRKIIRKAFNHEKQQPQYFK